MDKGVLKKLKGDVLLVGDAILDVYIYGDVVSQALYAPVPEMEEKKSEVFFGGNGLVASNILELGGTVHFVSVVGNDLDAKYYDSFKHPKLKKFILKDEGRKTTVKRRWYANGKALLQANQVSNHDIDSRIEKKVIKIVESQIKKVDVVVVMDPQHGLLTKGLIRGLIRLSKKYKKPMYVDAQISHRKSNHYLYKGVDTMLLNEKEAKAVLPKFNLTNLPMSLRLIKTKLDLNNVIVKLGDRGSAALVGDEFIKTSTLKVKALDVCGAGDAFLAAYSLGDRTKPKEALRVANVWGALSTTIHGTFPPKRTQLLKLLRG